ncbi:HAMP domain-containing sensor histidine kinase [Pseudomonas sp. SJZ079]|uniref:sensor histidine kinase n=1 Tax=Pseudomonas sp. SJZ079 TaxID=2572887 RepID=UPI0011BE555E|nr:HAMP domain-containing sensor histidine kinase [Pseudomonas sp. SJZ079]
MKRPRRPHSLAFRLALLAMVLFGALAALLLSFVYLDSVILIDQVTNAAIDAEIRALEEKYTELGIDGLREEIGERSNDAGVSGELYLLLAPDNSILAGNIGAWPQELDSDGTWLRFAISVPQRGAEATEHQVRAREFILPGKHRLLVGRDIEERLNFKRLIARALLWALSGTAALSLLSGLVLSRWLLARVNAISGTCAEIIAGNLAKRIPLSGRDDEFDRLSARLNDMLEQIERLTTGMRTAMDSISHDLRAPLTRLRSNIELTLLGEADVDVCRTALSAALAEVDRLLATFTLLLQIARAEAGIVPTDAMDLARLLEEIAELYEPVVEEQQMRLVSEIAGPALINGNRELLAQSLINLLENAIKFSPRGGVIRCALRLEGSRVCVEMADQGPGIAAQDRQQVLQRFVQLDSSRSTPGSGLGLSLVAAVAHLHHAQLVLADNQPGLRISLHFPALDERDAKDA